MTASATKKETIFKLLDKTSKIAKGLNIAAIPLFILNVVITGIGFYYFMGQEDMGKWGWGYPTLIMTVPLISVLAIMWILDSVTSVPSAVRNASDEFMQIVRHHRKKIELAENKKLSKFKYLRIVGKILWDATDVVDGIGMAAFIATPMFWFLYLGAFLGSFILGGIMIISIIVHHCFM